jgi:hypothetical protein
MSYTFKTFFGEDGNYTVKSVDEAVEILTDDWIDDELTVELGSELRDALAYYHNNIQDLKKLNFVSQELFLRLSELMADKGVIEETFNILADIRYNERTVKEILEKI